MLIIFNMNNFDLISTKLNELEKLIVDMGNICKEDNNNEKILIDILEAIKNNNDDVNGKLLLIFEKLARIDMFVANDRR